MHKFDSSWKKHSKHGSFTYLYISKTCLLESIFLEIDWHHESRYIGKSRASWHTEHVDQSQINKIFNWFFRNENRQSFPSYLPLSLPKFHGNTVKGDNFTREIFFSRVKSELKLVKKLYFLSFIGRNQPNGTIYRARYFLMCLKLYLVIYADPQ